MHFFATREDLLAVTAHVEGIEPLDYILFGHQPSPRIERIGNGSDLPRFGVASGPSTAHCDKYVVVPRGHAINARRIPRADGDVYSIDQMENAGSIVLAPGGGWGENMLFYGHVSTVHDTPAARTLLRRFEAAIRKRFEKIQAFRVGPGAVVLLERGFRLCPAEQSPATYDLRRPP